MSRLRRLFAAPILVLAFGLGACSAGETEGPAPPNIILVSIDSLRADHLGAYGYGRDTSPVIDALAREGALFEAAVSQAPWTLPAHASLLTSLYGRTHQTDDHNRRLPDHVPTLAASLLGAGYATGAVVSGTLMQARFGLGRGFEVYDDTLARVGHRQSHKQITSPETVEKAVELMDAGEPFFLFTHFWDVHYDYVPPPPYDTMFDPDYSGSVKGHGFIKNDSIHAKMDPADLRHVVALYDGEIAWVDHHMGLLMEGLRQRELDERTIVVVTADHGDEFFEHGRKGHMHALYEELLHVPLIVWGKGIAPRRVTDRVELIDVMPTLLELAGVPVPSNLQGRSLLPLLRGEPRAARPAFAETTNAYGEGRVKSYSSCVYSDTSKLILFAEDRYPAELYDLAADPGESRNLADDKAPSTLARVHAAWLERTPRGTEVPNDGLDEATLEHLKSLGYVDDV